MGNALQENKRVKRAITDALFALMEKKAFSEITISEIVRTGGVARASFYRNFDSKEAIIDDLFNRTHLAIIPPGSRSNFDKISSREEFVRQFEHLLTFILTKRSQFLTLYNNGFGSQLQNLADIYIEEIAGDMHHNSANKYLLYCFSGASMNMLIHWLQDGATETAHDLALACADYYLQMIQLYRPLPWK